MCEFDDDDDDDDDPFRCCPSSLKAETTCPNTKRL